MECLQLLQPSVNLRQNALSCIQRAQKPSIFNGFKPKTSLPSTLQLNFTFLKTPLNPSEASFSGLVNFATSENQWGVGVTETPDWPMKGIEASLSDQQVVILQNAKVVVESKDDNKIEVRVDLTGKETQKVYNDVLRNLARTAPPVPGFRKMKGGKTSDVPPSFIIQSFGQDRIINFVIQEILTSTIDQYVKKVDLNVKKSFETTQSAEELKSAYSPGKEFGFNATLEIEVPETEATGSSPAEV